MEPAGPLRFDYTLGVPDLLAVLQRNTDASLPKASESRLALATLIGCLAGVFALLSLGAGSWGVALAIGAAAGAGWWLYLPGRVRHRVMARMARRLAEPANAPMLGPRTLTLDPDGLTLTSPVADLRYRWAGLQRLVVTPGRLFLYVSGMQAHVIPLGAAETAALLASLRALAPALAVVDEGGP